MNKPSTTFGPRFMGDADYWAAHPPPATTLRPVVFCVGGVPVQDTEPVGQPTIKEGKRV